MDLRQLYVRVEHPDLTTDDLRTRLRQAMAVLAVDPEDHELKMDLVGTDPVHTYIYGPLRNFTAHVTLGKSQTQILITSDMAYPAYRLVWAERVIRELLVHGFWLHEPGPEG